MKGLSRVAAAAAFACLTAQAQAEELLLDTTGLVAGTACNADVGYWNTGGFTNFDIAMERCTTCYVDTSALSNNNGEAEISLCMQDDEPTDKSCDLDDPYTGESPYSITCADCMGQLAGCVMEKCLANVLDLALCLGGQESQGCRACTIENCAPAFYECGGLDSTRDPNRDYSTSEPPILIIVGAVGGACALFVTIGLVVLIGRHNRRLAKSRDEFALQLSAAAANAPKVTAMVPESYEVETVSLNRALVTLFPFEADHESELTVPKGANLVGMQIVDGEWWLARDNMGNQGLVPTSYVEETGGAVDLAAEAPDF